MQRTKERELLIEKENALLDHKLGANLTRSMKFRINRYFASTLLTLNYSFYHLQFNQSHTI